MPETENSPKLPNVHVTELVVEEDRIVEQAVSPMICDFCGDITPVWDYDCADFEYDIEGAPPGGSQGGWLACGPCSEYIETDDRIKLTDRSMMSSPEIPGSPEWMENWEKLRAFQELFFANRYGERRRWDGDDGVSG